MVKFLKFDTYLLTELTVSEVKADIKGDLEEYKTGLAVKGDLLLDNLEVENVAQALGDKTVYKAKNIKIKNNPNLTSLKGLDYDLTGAEQIVIANCPQLTDLVDLPFQGKELILKNLNLTEFKSDATAGRLYVYEKIYFIDLPQFKNFGYFKPDYHRVKEFHIFNCPQLKDIKHIVDFGEKGKMKVFIYNRPDLKKATNQEHLNMTNNVKFYKKKQINLKRQYNKKLNLN